MTVELLDAGAPFRSQGLAGHAWPCLGCGERRAVEQARTVVVRESGDPPMRRHILLCELCLHGYPADASRQGSEEPEPA